MIGVFEYDGNILTFIEWKSFATVDEADYDTLTKTIIFMDRAASGMTIPQILARYDGSAFEIS